MSCLLTFKGLPVDEASQSKPEHETQVEAQSRMDSILRGLGLAPLVSFEKHCRNFSLRIEGRNVLATLVRVPELDETFLEVETMVDSEAEVQAGLRLVGDLLADLGIDRGDLTTVAYTSLVMQKRGI
jgi:adenylate cyclase, class 2